MKSKKHLLAALGAYVIWGFFPFFLKKVSAYDSLHVLYFRVLFAALASLLVVLLFMRKSVHENFVYFKSLARNDKYKQAFLVLIGGVLLSINWLLYIYTVNNISIQNASFAYMLCPVLTALLGFVILKEKMHNRHWVAVALATVSCILLSSQSLRNMASTLCIAFSYAFYLISQKKTGHFNRMITLTIQLCTGILLIMFAFGQAGISPVIDTYLLLMTVMIAVVFTVVPLLLNLFSLAGLSSGSVAFLMYVNPLLNFMVAFLIFHEPATTVAMVAYACMVLAVVVYNSDRIFTLKSA